MYKKINKKMAEKLYNERKPFIMVSKNLRPEFGVVFNGCSFEQLIDCSFEETLSAFSYYNGKTAYYVEVK